LKRTIASLRRRARTLAEAVEVHDLPDIAADREIELVRMAVAHISGSRDVEQLIACVAQLTVRVDAFQEAVDAALEARAAESAAPQATLETPYISPKGEIDCVDSTTTTQLPSAYAVTSRGFARKSSEGWDIARLAPKSAVEDDLEKHGISPSFIVEACPGLIWDLEPGPRAWGRLVSIAENLVAPHAISNHAWREACRIMGEKGAAAAVIATVFKAMTGEVRSPGAYLRGMSQKALSGGLHLGKTYHGLREAASEAA
jgi:replication initiation protein RepC